MFGHIKKMTAKKNKSMRLHFYDIISEGIIKLLNEKDKLSVMLLR